MKRLILSGIVFALTISLFVFPAAAADSQEPDLSSAPFTDVSAEDSPELTEAEDADNLELMATVSATINCPRTISVTASSSSPAYLYRSPTATTVTDKASDKYNKNVSLYCTGYVILSDGTTRFRFTAKNGLTGESLTYYIPYSSKVSITTIHHSYTTASAHPHTKSCPCGYAVNTTSSSCLQCYPSYITYNANGGTGAPSKQTVTASPFTVSSTVPTRFPYRFMYWSTNTDGTGSIYYSNSSYSLSSNTSKTVYAAWANPVTLSAGSKTYSVSLSNPGSAAYYAFTPTETDTYVFESVNTTGDTVGYLYDASGNQLTTNDDGGESTNFKISYELTAGTTYYYKAKWYSTSTTGSIKTTLRQQFTVTYDANGGTGAPAAQDFLQDTSFQLTTTVPVRDSYVFAGWADTSDAETFQYQAGGDFSASADQTLYAVWAYPSGSCGTDATWLFRDNTLYILGLGAMENYSASSKAPWDIYTENITSIVIADEITSIGSYAFSDCSNASSLQLPDNLASIGSYAFYNCSSLTSLDIPAGISAIAEYTFNGCSGLQQVTLPETVSSIGANAFFGCSGLQELVLPSSVQQLGEYAFAKCTALASINLPTGITTIPAHLFDSNSQLSQVVLPGTVDTIGEFAFSGCAALTEMIVPSSVLTIERAAFSQCTALTTVTIPDSVTTIGTSIFAYVSDRVTVRCYLDTPIYQYALENDLAYELMSWGVLESPSFLRKDYSGGATIELSAPKGDIYYTIDGTDPSVSGILYEAPITAQKNFTIKAIAVCEGWETSPVATFDTAIPKVSAPAASMPSGSRVTAGTVITLSCATEGAQIWYTTNGELPTAADIYTSPITIQSDTTIYALAVKDGMLTSALVHLTYELTTAESVPTITTLDAVNITENSATVSADLGDSTDVYYVQFVYYEKNNSKVRYTVEADENNTAVLTGLSPDTEYWFQARAVNDVGWNTGHICSFMTEPAADTKPTSITLDPTYLSLNVGKSKTILATVLPLSADSRGIYWSSEDTGVATVDNNGTVTAVGLGNTRIKAMTESNRLVAYCNVDVISTEISGTFDFSELNMITNSSSYDEHGYDHSVNDGGNALMASAYLARWDGVVLEGNDPYPASLSEVKYRELESEYHVQNILYLPYRSDSLDNDEIKSAVMKYGAVYTALKINYSYFSDNQTNYYLPSNVNKINGGHAITIVGWDDNYPRTAFSTTPPADGAFICKNSWGTDSGEDGYFYVSYYDKHIARASCGDFNAVFYDLQSTDNYNKIYQYDYLGPVVAKSFSNRKAYISNVFPENGSSLSEDEELMAVSFYNYTPGTSYEVYVVQDYTGKSSLRNLGDPVASGMLDYAGYFTVDLDASISLKAGTRFAVVVQYISPGNSTTIFMELPTTISAGGTLIDHSSNARANADESYISNDGKIWSDSTSWTKNSNVCVKAFTKVEGSELLLQGIDNLGRMYEDDTVYTFEELAEDGYLYNPAIEEMCYLTLFDDGEDVNFGSVAPSILPDLNTNNNYAEGCAFPARYDLRDEGCMTPVKNQGNIGSCWSFATYASLESAIKKATASASSLSADGLSQAAGSASGIELSHDGILLAQGSTQQLVASVLPFGSDSTIIWSTSDPQVATVSAHGLVTTVGTGNAYITASAVNGTVTAQCSVTVTAPATLRFLSIDNAQRELSVGDSLLLEYSQYPSNAALPDLVWTVDDQSVAKINEHGLLTAVHSGTVTVTLSTSDGAVTAQFTVSITGGSSIRSEIVNDSFAFTDDRLSGSLTLSIENNLAASQDCLVWLALFSPDGQFLSAECLEMALQSGSNTIYLSDLSLPIADNSAVTMQVFVLDASGSYLPLADVFSKTVTHQEVAQ